MLIFNASIAKAAGAVPGKTFYYFQLVSKLVLQALVVGARPLLPAFKTST